MNYFCNEAIDFAIKKYLNSFNDPQGEAYNSFLVSVIRMLFIIYGQLDILTPYYNKNEELINANLKKFGLTDKELIIFKDNLEKFYEIENNNNQSIVKRANEFYIKIEKDLIDMLSLKKDKSLLTPEQQNEFKSILFSNDSKEPYKIAYNFLNANDVNYITEYYNYKLFKEDRTIIVEERLYLDPTSYYILKHNIDEVKKMKIEELKVLNDQVFEFFKVDKNNSDKINLLDKAIRDYLKFNNKITSGSGFVDGLLLLAIISTCVMIYYIVKIFV